MKTLYGQDLVNELRAIADSLSERLWIAVPYIGSAPDIKKIIGSNWIDNPKLSIRLITDTNEFTRINNETIKLFYEHGCIKHLSGVHAKIYILDNTCLITSANLTKTAFTKRHEIGVFLEGHFADDAIAIFENWWEKSEEISKNSLKVIIDEKNIYSEESGNNLPVLWELPSALSEINYWLKPIGFTEEPVTENRLFNELKTPLDFSQQPVGVKVKDVFIAYGVGAKRILSVYRGGSSPIRYSEAEIIDDDRKERWSWYILSDNLTPNFGEQWSHHNLYASNLVQEYLIKNPNGFITKVGGKTLGALSFRKDKIHLDSQFAQYIIDRVEKLNEPSKKNLVLRLVYSRENNSIRWAYKLSEECEKITGHVMQSWTDELVDISIAESFTDSKTNERVALAALNLTGWIYERLISEFNQIEVHEGVNNPQFFKFINVHNKNKKRKSRVK